MRRQGLEPRTRGLRVRCSGVLLLQSTSIFTASTLARYPQPAEAEYRLRTACTAWYRDIRANMEQTWEPEGLDQCGKMITTALDEGPGLSAESGPGLAWPVDTIRNLHQYRHGNPVARKRRNGPGRWTSDIPAVYLRCTRVSATARHGAFCGEAAWRPHPPIHPGHMSDTVSGTHRARPEPAPAPAAGQGSRCLPLICAGHSGNADIRHRHGRPVAAMRSGLAARDEPDGERGHRPDADRRAAAPAGGPGRVRRALQPASPASRQEPAATGLRPHRHHPRSPTWRRLEYDVATSSAA